MRASARVIARNDRPPRVVRPVVTGLWIALAAVVLALAYGGYRALVDGRFRPRASAGPGSGPSVEPGSGPSVEPGSRGTSEAVSRPTQSVWQSVVPAASGAEPGPRATLVQFSSAFCAPCRATRRILSDVADLVPGVVHVEVDAEQHLEVVRELGVTRTPTTIVLDGTGREVARAAGAPRKEQVLAALP